jgi:hypothetical protein
LAFLLELHQLAQVYDNRRFTSRAGHVIEHDKTAGRAR